MCEMKDVESEVMEKSLLFLRSSYHPSHLPVCAAVPARISKGPGRCLA